MSPILGKRTRLTLRPEGPLDVGHAARLREQLREQITCADDHVVLDLSAVTLIDSAGLSVLVTSQRLADGLGARLRILDPQPAVERVLQITRVAKMLDLGTAAGAERAELVAA